MGEASHHIMGVYNLTYCTDLPVSPRYPGVRRSLVIDGDSCNAEVAMALARKLQFGRIGSSLDVSLKSSHLSYGLRLSTHLFLLFSSSIGYAVSCKYKYGRDQFERFSTNLINLSQDEECFLHEYNVARSFNLLRLPKWTSESVQCKG